MPQSKPIKKLSKDEISHFWSKIVKSSDTNGCWNWMGQTDKDGYGKVHIRDMHLRAHRIAYLLQNKKDPLELMVCHSCDNTSCCRGNHLFLGTAKDNKEDCISKGRSIHGEKQWKSKATVDTVIEIRGLWATGDYTQNELSAQFKMSKHQIHRIVNGESWKHIPMPDNIIKNIGFNGKLKSEQVYKIKELFTGGNENVKYLSNLFSISEGAIYDIVKGRTYKHLLPKTG